MHHVVQNKKCFYNIFPFPQLLFFNFIFSFVGANIDWSAHFGGLLAGVMVGTAICRPMSARWAASEQKIRAIAWAVTVFFLGGMTVGVFFLPV